MEAAKRKSAEKTFRNPEHKLGDKVLLVTGNYVFGKITEITVKDNAFYYTLTFTNRDNVVRVKEDIVLPYMRKWKFNFHKLFNWIAT